MGTARKYHVTHNGYKTVLKLNEQDLASYPDAVPFDAPTEDPKPAPAKKARRPANKARTAENKQE